MGKLVPFNKKMQKQMGWVNTKNGPMVDSSKLADKKKYAKPEIKTDEKKEVKKEKSKMSAFEKQRLEVRGVY